MLLSALCALQVLGAIVVQAEGFRVTFMQDYEPFAVLSMALLQLICLLVISNLENT